MLLAMAAIIFFAVHARAASQSDSETFNYKVMYKWGLVNKQAGRATLTLNDDGSGYVMRLTGRSESWADHFYRVRDTLIGTMERETLRPLVYEKRAHEGGDHKHDVVRFSYHGSKVSGDCTRRKWDSKGRIKVDESRTLEAYGTTVDMLSSFFYMRRLPYEKWNPGHVITVNIFSGKRKELLTIKYIGRTSVNYDKKSFDCYHISFNFTADGRKQTSDPMEAWITSDTARIPVKLEGKLKVGKVRCFYTGN